MIGEKQYEQVEMKHILLIVSLFIVFTSCNDLSQNSSQPTNQTAQSGTAEGQNKNQNEPNDQPQPTPEPSDPNEGQSSKESSLEQNDEPKQEDPTDEPQTVKPKGKYTILFVGRDYNDDNISEFYKHVELVKTVLFSLEPFKSYKDKIDVVVKKENDFKTDYDVIHTIINNTTTDYGRAWPNNKKSESNSKNINSAVHELGHSIGRLWDEYNPRYSYANTSPTKDGAKWAPLVGFMDIGISNTIDPISQWFVPTHNCIMGSNTGSGRFCEVCKYALAVKMSSVITGKTITMYDVATLDDVITYDTYNELKKHLNRGG